MEKNNLIVSRKAFEIAELTYILLSQVGHTAIIIVPSHRVATQLQNKFRKTELDIKIYYKGLSFPETFDVLIITRRTSSDLAGIHIFNRYAWNKIKLIAFDHVCKINRKNPQARLVKKILNEGASPRIIAFTSFLTYGTIPSETLLRLLKISQNFTIENIIYLSQKDGESSEEQSSQPLPDV